MTPEEVTAMWTKSADDAEGMRLGYTTQQHYFAALVAAAAREACAEHIADLQENGDRLARAGVDANTLVHQRIDAVAAPLRQRIVELEDEINEQVAEYKQDAERYRWLRDNDHLGDSLPWNLVNPYVEACVEYYKDIDIMVDSIRARECAKSARTVGK